MTDVYLRKQESEVPEDGFAEELERYRRYLQFLARTHLSRRYQGRVDPSDIVQQSLLKAIASNHQFRGCSEPEKLAWLRKILVRTVSQTVRDMHLQKRDVNRELSIEEDIENSSLQLRGFLVASTSTPSQRVLRNEQAIELAAAIEQLPADQRTAIIKKYWHSMTMREIADSMNRSVPSVAGLLHRANKSLRSHFVD